MGIKSWVRNRVSLVAGQVQAYEPRIRSTNALYIINNNAAEVKAAPGLDVANNPEVTVKPNSNGPVPLAAPGEMVYLYAGTDVNITVIEIATDDLAVVFAMQVVVSDISSAVDISDRATRAVGKAGLQVGGADVSAVNPIPVDLVAGDQVDVSDRVARALGLVGPAAASVWDVSDRAARALGLVGPAAASVWDVSDRAARSLGLVGPAAASVWDVSDRAARQLGQVDLTDKAGREVGKVYPGGWTSVKITAAAAGIVAVKAAPGQVAAILPLAAVGVTLQDNGADKWAQVTAEKDFGAHPIQCDTNIQLNFAAAGDAWVLYR